MKAEYDAIVVGGRIAGLTSAAYLSRSGARTLLVEKREKTGGLVNTFWHQGFAFDGGIRAFENSGILLPMLKSLGIEMDFIRDIVFIQLYSTTIGEFLQPVFVFMVEKRSYLKFYFETAPLFMYYVLEFLVALVRSTDFKISINL